MGAGFHAELQQANAAPMQSPRAGRMLAPRRSDYGRIFYGDPDPVFVQQIIYAAAFGDPASQNDLFDKMVESDPHIRCESRKRRMAITGLKWEIESASMEQDSDRSDADNQLADEVAAYVRGVLRRIKGLRCGLAHLIDGVGRGLALCEFEWRKIGEARVPIAAHYVPLSRCKYSYEEPWRLRVMLDEADHDGFPVDKARPGKFVVHAPEPIGGSPLRGGLYRTATLWYVFKHYGVQFFMKAIELFGQPFRTATYPASATEEVKSAMLQMLEEMGISAAGIFPEGSVFNVHESGFTSGGSKWPQERLIALVDAQISKLFVGATLMTEVGDAGGNRALGEVQNEVREDIRDDDIAAESETITEQLIRPIVANSPFAARGGMEYVPTFKRIVPEPSDDNADAQRLDQAVNNWGMKVPIRYAVERFGIPVVEDVDQDAPLEGSGSASPFGAFDSIENSHRLKTGAAELRVVANRRLAEIVKRRRSPVSRLSSWIFAAVLASAAHTENVLGAVGDFVSRRRDLTTALAELPAAFDELPTDDMSALQEQFLIASRMSGMLETRSKILRRVNSDRLETGATKVIANAELVFDAIPFVKAIDSLRERLDLTPDEFEQLDAEARSRAFRVAAVWNMRLLSDIHRELAASIEAGETARDFKLRLPEMADRNGWSGENPWHADVVHFQNFVMAHGAGRYAEYREFGVDTWRFVANGDSCPICEPVVGKVFRLSDRRFYPPLHFWCDCDDEPLFEGEFGDDEVADSQSIKNPDLDAQRARPSGFQWDPAQYANLEPISLGSIVPALVPRFADFAREQNWEVVS